MSQKQLWVYATDPSPKDVESTIRKFVEQIGITPTHLYVKLGKEELFKRIATGLVVSGKSFMLDNCFAIAREEVPDVQE